MSKKTNELTPQIDVDAIPCCDDRNTKNEDSTA
jgi:hypothetical protein